MARPAAHRRHYRSVFLSDVHLGAPACRAEALLDFLDGLTCERLYLLGDVVDGWRLKRRWHWPASHAAVLERLLEFGRGGTEVVYVPGNHDSFARRWSGMTVAGIRIEVETTHRTADGRTYLLAHGDAYDPGSRRPWPLRLAGDLLYRALLRMDGAARAVRRDWTVAAAIKTRAPFTGRVIARYEAQLGMQARARGFAGVICGHIHSPALRDLDGVRYVNCGDWTESVSAVVEHAGGGLELVRPAAPVASPRRPPSAIAPSPVMDWRRAAGRASVQA